MSKGFESERAELLIRYQDCQLNLMRRLFRRDVEVGTLKKYCMTSSHNVRLLCENARQPVYIFERKKIDYMFLMSCGGYFS